MRGTQSRGDAGGNALLLVDEHHRFIERPVSSSTTITEIGRNGPHCDRISWPWRQRSRNRH
jgi:hypothetical protein